MRLDAYDRAARARGFTLLELALVMALVGLLLTLVVPRLGILGGLELDTSASRLATRIRYLREEAALRGAWIRLVVDAREGRYRAERLVRSDGGEEQFVADDHPLLRATALPSGVSIELEGAGVTTTPDGWLATLFSPDGYADPAVVHLRNAGGRSMSVVIRPAHARPEIRDSAEPSAGAEP